MIANVAFLAAVVTFLSVAWMASELAFLAPFRDALFREYGDDLVTTVIVFFLNVCAIFYGIARWLFLRDTGRKLAHIDRQLSTPDAVIDDLHRDLRL
jgi:hypothetical protein